MFTDADNFVATFPADCTLEEKATLMGGVLLIDFVFFEKGNDNNSGGF